MDDYRLHTPEQVDISYTVAGLGTRFIALALDTLIQSALLFVLILSMVEVWDRSDWTGDWYVALVILLSAVIYYGYFFILELAMKGRTPGKAAAGIRVVRMDGRNVDVPGILLRNLMRIIDSLPLVYTVGVIAMFISKDSRRLGDLAAGTVVVVGHPQTRLSDILAEQRTGNAPGPAVSGALTDQEYAIVRDFIARSPRLAPEARQRLAYAIAGPLFDRMGVPYEQRGYPEAFLQSLLQ